MFELIGSIFSIAFGLVKAGLGLAMGAVQFVLGLFGGLFSLVMSLGGFMLAGALVMLAVFRRKEHRKRRAQPYADSSEQRTYDVDKEEFTSFYDQFRSAE